MRPILTGTCDIMVRLVIVRAAAVVLAVLIGALPAWAQTGSITGTVMDAESGEPLPGTNVTIVGTDRGTVSDSDGRYVLSDLGLGDHVVEFSFTGYRTRRHEVLITGADPVTLDVSLTPGIELDPLQVTAGRQPEKVLDAPASISILSAQEIERAAPLTSVQALRDIVGLDYAQTGIDRQEVVLRGFNNAFSGAALVLTDYRQSSEPVINVNFHNVMPAIPIELDRVEVVRGPGSALYGAGVGAGVIHYQTKSAFEDPGLTVAATGGQQSLLNFQGRLAGTVTEKLGLRIVGFYGQARDFELESCAPELIRQQQFSECPDALDAQQLYTDGPRDTRFRKSGVKGGMEYRFNNDMRLHADAGFGTVSSVLLSGVGTIQADDYFSGFAQLRFSTRRFFAQAYTNLNDSKESFVYGGDPITGLSRQTNIQAQYGFHLMGDRQRFIVGMDLEFASPFSKNTIYGINEGEGTVHEYGAYAQSTSEIGSRLELVAALRADYHNAIDGVHVSPRVALVYKSSDNSSLRIAYNNSFVNPSAIELFLNLSVGRIPIGPGTFMEIRGRGALDGFTWNRNPDYLDLGASSDLVASSLVPGMVGLDMPVGLPTAQVYGLLYEGLTAIPRNDLAQMLLDEFGLPAQLLPLLELQIPGVVAQLHPDNTIVQGFSQGQLGLLNLTTQEIVPISNDLDVISPIKPQVSQTVEVGYKAILGNRVLVNLDAYYAKKKNFAGGLFVASPLVLMPTLSEDLKRDLALGIETNSGLDALFGLVSTLTGLDLSSQAVADFLVAFAADQLPDEVTPVAVVQPVENHPGVGQIPDLVVTYPNYGNFSHFGADFAVQVLASESLSLFGNVSWVSDDYFDNEEIKEERKERVVALNAPTLKIKFGGALHTASGLSVNLSARYAGGFRMVSGTYIGTVEPYLQADVSVGYRFGASLRTDLSVSNVLGNKHREFIGAPKIGRVGTVRLLYTLHW